MPRPLSAAPEIAFEADIPLLTWLTAFHVCAVVAVAGSGVQASCGPDRLPQRLRTLAGADSVPRG